MVSRRNGGGSDGVWSWGMTQIERSGSDKGSGTKQCTEWMPDKCAVIWKWEHRRAYEVREDMQYGLFFNFRITTFEAFYRISRSACVEERVSAVVRYLAIA